MPISPADLLIRRSITSVSGVNSLGGVMTTTQIASQTLAFTLAGVTPVYAGGLNSTVASSFIYNFAAQTLQLRNGSEGTPGPAVTISGDGEYYLYGANSGSIVVSIVAASLPTADAVVSVAVLNVAQNLFDDITPQQALAGDVSYRAIYLYNKHPTDSFINLRTYIKSQPTAGDVLAIGYASAGVGDGATSGVAQSLTDEFTAPTGVSFTSPTTPGAGISIGPIAAGQAVALWIRRTVTTGATSYSAADLSSIGLQVTY